MLTSNPFVLTINQSALGYVKYILFEVLYNVTMNDILVVFWWCFDESFSNWNNYGVRKVGSFCVFFSAIMVYNFLSTYCGAPSTLKLHKPVAIECFKLAYSWIAKKNKLKAN